MAIRNIKLRNWAIIAAFAILAAIGLYFVRSENSGNRYGEGKTVKVDANLPISGEFAIWGSSIRDGATLSLRDIEKSDPMGPKLNFEWQDNAGSPQTAVSIFQKQFLEPPVLYVSGIKPQLMAIKDQVDAKGTPNFVWIFDVSINKNSNNNFRTLVSYKIEAPVYLKYAKERQAKRVAIIYTLLPHAEEQFQKLVIPQLKKMGVEAVFTEAYDLGLKDYKDIANKVKKFQPDLIILNGFQNTLVGIVRALRPLGLITDGNTIGTYDMIDAGKILGKDETEGIRVVAPLFESRPDREKVVQWKEHFRSQYNRQPLYIEAFAYDMVTIMHNAAKRLKLPATSEQWIEAISETKVECITGNPFCYFDKDGDLVTPLEIAVFRDGKLVPLESANKQ